MQKNYLNLLIMTSFIILGIAIGTLFEYGFVVFDEAGAFGGGSWKHLKSPLKFEHISNVTTLTIWARTEENKLYKQRYCLSDSNCNQWIETNEVVVDPLEENQLDAINKYTCTPHGLKYAPDPHGKVLECALATKYWSVEIRDIVYYALLDDGTIWVWSSSGPWYVDFEVFMALGAPILGIALGLLMYIVFQKYQQTKAHSRNHS
jgi:hypothetical protein